MTPETKVDALRELLERCKQREYNAFEPDNQSKLYYDIEAAIPDLAQHITLAQQALRELITDWCKSLSEGSAKKDRERLVEALAQHIALEVQAAYERAAQRIEKLRDELRSDYESRPDAYGRAIRDTAVALDLTLEEVRALGSASALELALAQREKQTAGYILMNAETVDLNEYIAEIERRIAALSGAK